MYGSFFLKKTLKLNDESSVDNLILVEGAVDSVLDVYTNLVTSRVFEVPEISLWVMYQLHMWLMANREVIIHLVNRHIRNYNSLIF